jgi:hypothetical protein
LDHRFEPSGPSLALAGLTIFCIKKRFLGFAPPAETRPPSATDQRMASFTPTISNSADSNICFLEPGQTEVGDLHFVDELPSPFAFTVSLHKESGPERTSAMKTPLIEGKKQNQNRKIRRKTTITLYRKPKSIESKSHSARTESTFDRLTGERNERNDGDARDLNEIEYE